MGGERVGVVEEKGCCCCWEDIVCDCEKPKPWVRNCGEIFRSAVKAIGFSGLMGAGGGLIVLTWLDTRLKDRLSVSSSENRSLRFISNLGTGFRDRWCGC
jgi:hypothetical protein